jgi:hypothetical protein
MKLAFALTVVASLFTTGHGFQPSPLFVARRHQPATGVLKSTPLSGDAMERMKTILQEESMNPANFASSAKQMQNMSPAQMDQMIKEMDMMTPAQRENLKSLGMDPDLMKSSMKMMRDNPAMMASVGKMMESMTPEQLLEQSRKAQEQMSQMSPEQVEQAAMAAKNLSAEQFEAATKVVTSYATQTGEAGSSSDPNVIDNMFRVAELMSSPPTGGVTKLAFATLPPIVALSGDRQEDLSKKEFAECWADGSLGATRVDRQGFERVWNEVQEFFDDDIMEAARKTIVRNSKAAKGGVVTPEVVSAPKAAAAPAVGASLNAEQMAAMSDEVKNMSDDQMSTMLEQMANMTPEQRERMKAMGVDPGMMEKTANMMKGNKTMMKAAAAMMKNLSPDQMMKMSQQAQQQMAGMSKEEYEKALNAMNKMD